MKGDAPQGNVSRSRVVARIVRRFSCLVAKPPRHSPRRRRFPMIWLSISLVIALFGGLGIVVNVNQVREKRRGAREMRALVAIPPSRVPRFSAGELPPPVARYQRLAVGERAPVRTLRLRHGGTFRMSAT